MSRISFRLVSSDELKKKTPTERRDRLWDTTKKDFVATATHQLRTPLVGIKWTLNTLVRGEAGEINEEQEHWLTSAYRSNERVLTMVDSILNAIRVEEGAVKFTPEEVDVGELFNSAIEEMLGRAQEKDISVELDIDDDIPHIQADREKLRVALQNIIDNAIKYTHKGGSVRVSVAKEEGNVKISVADTGIGIPDDEKKDVFERFFRARNAMQMVNEGSGLGLYISKSVIEKHNGQIWFDSTEREGTTFYVIIPYHGLMK